MILMHIAVYSIQYGYTVYRFHVFLLLLFSYSNCSKTVLSGELFDSHSAIAK